MFDNMNNPFMMADQDTMIDINNTNGNIDIDVNQGQNYDMGAAMGTTQAPIIEPMRERVINRTIEHVVPQPCPFM